MSFMKGNDQATYQARPNGDDGATKISDASSDSQGDVQQGHSSEAVSNDGDPQRPAKVEEQRPHHHRKHHKKSSHAADSVDYIKAFSNKLGSLTGLSLTRPSNEPSTEESNSSSSATKTNSSSQTDNRSNCHGHHANGIPNVLRIGPRSTSNSEQDITDAEDEEPQQLSFASPPEADMATTASSDTTRAVKGGVDGVAAGNTESPVHKENEPPKAEKRKYKAKKTKTVSAAAKRHKSNSEESDLTGEDGSSNAPVAVKPKRPLSAYNFFFRDERARIIAERKEQGTDDVTAPAPNSNRVYPKHKTPHRKISFASLGKLIASRWKSLDDKSRGVYHRMAEKDSDRYRTEMNLFYERENAKRRAKYFPSSKADDQYDLEDNCDSTGEAPAFVLNNASAPSSVSVVSSVPVPAFASSGPAPAFTSSVPTQAFAPVPAPVTFPVVTKVTPSITLAALQQQQTMPPQQIQTMAPQQQQQMLNQQNALLFALLQQTMGAMMNGNANLNQQRIQNQASQLQGLLTLLGGMGNVAQAPGQIPQQLQIQQQPPVQGFVGNSLMSAPGSAASHLQSLAINLNQGQQPQRSQQQQPFQAFGGDSRRPSAPGSAASQLQGLAAGLSQGYQSPVFQQPQQAPSANYHAQNAFLQMFNPPPVQHPFQGIPLSQQGQSNPLQQQQKGPEQNLQSQQLQQLVQLLAGATGTSNNAQSNS